MADGPQRQRAMSRQAYLAALPLPSADEIHRIEDIQLQHVREIDRKYRTAAEHDAATTIQKAYRGHRERRQLIGMTLDPSSRWSELIRELRFRSIVAQSSGGRCKKHDENGACLTAREHWSKAALIAEHASAGEPLKSNTALDDHIPADDSMTMDLRYFLEMVDEKHRYGSNLQMYHEQWQQSQTNQNFFHWLDHGEGRYITLPYCDRAKLEREQIRYLSREERQNYLVEVDDDGRLRYAKNGSLVSTDNLEYRDSMHGIVARQSTEPTFTDAATRQHLSETWRLNRKLAAIRDRARSLSTVDDTETGDSDHSWDSDSETLATTDPAINKLHQGVTCDKTPSHHYLHVSPATMLNHLLRKSVRKGTWIYVVDTVGRLYIGIKSSGAFQHASFLSGGRISSAGSIAVVDGCISYLSPLSGHYRPTTHSFRSFIDLLKAKHADLSQMRISSAYRVLRGMEHYSHARAGVHRLKSTLHGRGDGG